MKELEDFMNNYERRRKESESEKKRIDDLKKDQDYLNNLEEEINNYDLNNKSLSDEIKLNSSNRRTVEKPKFFNNEFEKKEYGYDPEPVAIDVSHINNNVEKFNYLYKELEEERSKIYSLSLSDSVEQFYEKFKHHFYSINYGQNDVYEFIRKYQKNKSGDEAQQVAFFSGAIINHLNTIGSIHNSIIQMNFDGKGQHYEYLFAGIREFSNLIVSNVNGNNCCAEAGQNKLIVPNMIALHNITGDYCGQGMGIKCRHQQITFDNIKGDNCGSLLCSQGGYCRTVMFRNIKGDWCGSMMENCDNVLFSNIRGRYYAENLVNCRNVTKPRESENESIIDDIGKSIGGFFSDLFR